MKTHSVVRSSRCALGLTRNRESGLQTATGRAAAMPIGGFRPDGFSEEITSLHQLAAEALGAPRLGTLSLFSGRGLVRQFATASQPLPERYLDIAGGMQ